MGVIITALAAVCAFIQSNVGFGFNIMFMSLGPHFIDYSAAQVICFSGGMLGNITNVLPNIKKVNKAQVLIPAVSYCIATFIAIEFAKGLEVSVLRRMLGCMLFALCIYFILFSGKIKIRPGIKNAVIAGALSGFGGGLFAITGPPVAVYYLSALEDKYEYMATIQAYFFLTSGCSLILKLITGTFGYFSPVWAIYLVLGVVIGGFAGGKTFSKLNPNMVRLCVYIFMGLSGLWIFING